MNKKGFVAIEVLTIIFVPGALTMYLIAKGAKILQKFHLRNSKKLANNYD